MIRILKNSCFILVALLFLQSCGKQPKYLKFQDITNENWSIKDTLSFEIPPQEISEELPKVIVRHNSDYNFQNIWLLIKKDTLPYKRYEAALASPSGRWLGKKSGKLYTTELPIKDLISVKDSTKLSIVHAMRAESLSGIQSIGVKIK